MYELDQFLNWKRRVADLGEADIDWVAFKHLWPVMQHVCEDLNQNTRKRSAQGGDSTPKRPKADSPKRLPPRDLKTEWQAKLKSTKSRKLLRQEWKALSPTERDSVLPDLKLAYAQILADSRMTTSLEEFYENALTFRRKLPETWLELVADAMLQPHKITNTKAWLDQLHAWLKTRAELTLEARLVAWFDPDGDLPALSLLHTRFGLCAEGHFAGFWTAPVTRWLYAYQTRQDTKMTLTQCQERADCETLPKLGEQIINVLALVDPEFDMRTTGIFIKNQKSIASSSDLLALLLERVLPQGMSAALDDAPELRRCTCENICKVCHDEEGKRPSTAFPWLIGEVKIGNGCRSLETRNDKNKPLDKRLVLQTLLRRLKR